MFFNVFSFMLFSSLVVFVCNGFFRVVASKLQFSSFTVCIYVSCTLVYFQSFVGWSGNLL